MRYVLDASVAVAAVRPNEPDHVVARARVDRVLRGQDELVVPSLFPIEVAAALSRRAAWPERQIVSYIARLLGAPTRVALLGSRRALAVAQLAMVSRLRAADAVYVWLAAKEGVPLVTSDQEMLSRAPATCRVLPP